MVVVVAVMAVVGYVSQRALFNRTLGADPLPGILASFGLGIVIQNALLEHYTATDKSIAARRHPRRSRSGSPIDSRSAGSR